MRPLVDLFESTTWYPSYWLNQVKRAAEDDGPAQRLHWTGRNLWKVLAEWQAAPIRYRNRFEWVMQHVALAFPGKLARIEFVQGSPYLFAPGAMELEDGLPPRRAAAGMLTGLLHLTALAGTPKGGWVLFDEFENQLHPWAIRSLIAAARERALAHGIRVVLTTHSPVVLDAFADDPDQIFVMDGSTVQPQCLTDLHDDDVLAQSRLGTLYDRLFFGAPSTESPT
jgi:predicted ATPase